MSGYYDDHGIRFRYPEGWEVEETAEGTVTTVALHSGRGPAFALVTLDDSKPDPVEVADLAVEAMQEEYPDLEASPTGESIGGHAAIGHDVEFFSLDVLNSCVIRCFRTERRTVLVFGQWSDLEGQEGGDVLDAVRLTFEETDV